MKSQQDKETPGSCLGQEWQPPKRVEGSREYQNDQCMVHLNQEWDHRVSIHRKKSSWYPAVIFCSILAPSSGVFPSWEVKSPTFCKVPLYPNIKHPRISNENQAQELRKWGTHEIFRGFKRSVKHHFQLPTLPAGVGQQKRFSTAKCSKCCLQRSGQIIHQPRFPWSKGISLPRLHFGGPGRVRSL